MAQEGFEVRLVARSRGETLARGPYGEDDKPLVEVVVRLGPPVAGGTEFAVVLMKRGYRGP